MSTINSSPHSKNLRSHTAHSADYACGIFRLEHFRRDMVKESAGKVVGMPVAQFISNFLPLPDDSSRMKPFESGVFDELLHAKDLLENPIAEKWVSGG